MGLDDGISKTFNANLTLQINSPFQTFSSILVRLHNLLKAQEVGHWSDLVLEVVRNNVNTIMDCATSWPFESQWGCKVKCLPVTHFLSVRLKMKGLCSCSSGLNREVLWDRGGHVHGGKTDSAFESCCCGDTIVTVLILCVCVCLC